MTNQLNQTKIKPDLNPKQRAALKILTSLNSPIQELCYGGGAGGGKSGLGNLWLIGMSNKYAGTRWMIGGKELKKLKQSTIVTFFKMCKMLGIQEGIHFKYSDMKGEVVWSNGSTITLMDLADRPGDPECEYLGSVEFTGVFIDEASRISKKTKDMAFSRIRWMNDELGIPAKMLLTCNPSRNWLYNDYYKPWTESSLPSHRGFIQALVTDNPKIGKGYAIALSRMDAITKSRLLDGSWDYQDSAALFDYDALIDMFDFPDDYKTPEDVKKNLSIDVAHLGKDNTAIFIWENNYVIGIDELSKKTFPVQADHIAKKQHDHNITNSEIIMDLDGLSAGLYDLLPGAKGIHNNAKAMNDADFQNLKTQLYFTLADLVNTKQIKVKCTEDQQLKLTQELQVIKREKVDSDGKIMMTSKDQVKKLIGRSPDLSDAMCFKMYTVLVDTYYDVDEMFSFL